MTDDGAEPSAEDEDLKDVVCVLQEQVTLKTKEIGDLRAYIIALKEEHTAYCDKLELEIADYKIKYAQYKQSIQDYESFIEELQKQHAEKLRDELRDRGNEIIQLKLDFQTAKQRMNSSVGMQVQMMNEQKKAKEEAQKKGEELESLRQQV